MNKIIGAIVLSLIFVANARAQKTSEYTKDCKAWQRITSFEDAGGDTSHFSADEWFSAGACVGFASGVGNEVVGSYFIENGVVYRVDSSGVTNGKIVDVFLAYVNAHPESETDDANVTVVAALGTAGIITRTTIGEVTPSKIVPNSKQQKSPATKSEVPSGSHA